MRRWLQRSSLRAVLKNSFNLNSSRKQQKSLSKCLESRPNSTMMFFLSSLTTHLSSTHPRVKNSIAERTLSAKFSRKSSTITQQLKTLLNISCQRRVIYQKASFLKMLTESGEIAIKNSCRISGATLTIRALATSTGRTSSHSSLERYKRART